MAELATELNVDAVLGHDGIIGEHIADFESRASQLGMAELISEANFEYFRFWNFVSTMGSYVMAIGFFLTAGYLIHSMFKGRKAPTNPWGGRSLEWQCSSPPPHARLSS